MEGCHKFRLHPAKAFIALCAVLYKSDIRISTHIRFLESGRLLKK
jgi:hypothetical protein